MKCCSPASSTRIVGAVEQATTNRSWQFSDSRCCLDWRRGMGGERGRSARHHKLARPRRLGARMAAGEADQLDSHRLGGPPPARRRSSDCFSRRGKLASGRHQRELKARHRDIVYQASRHSSKPRIATRRSLKPMMTGRNRAAGPALTRYAPDHPHWRDRATYCAWRRVISVRRLAARSTPRLRPARNDRPREARSPCDLPVPPAY